MKKSCKTCKKVSIRLFFMIYCSILRRWKYEDYKCGEYVFRQEGEENLREIRIMSPMNISGGIDMYSFNRDRYKNDKSPEGRIVVFQNENGHESERLRAGRLFRKNQRLTVKEIYVGGYSSEVEFKEYPGKKFNTVMFADVIGEDEINEDIVKINNISQGTVENLMQGLNEIRNKIDESDRVDITIDFNKGKITTHVRPKGDYFFKITI